MALLPPRPPRSVPALTDERTVIRLYRALCLAGPGLILLIGHLQGDALRDPIWLRVAVSVPLLVLFGASFGDATRFLRAARGYLYVFTLWPAALVWFNPDEPYYVLSALFLYAALGLVYSLATQRPADLARYLVFSFAANFGAAAAVAPSGLGRTSLLVELGLTGLLVFYTTLARIRGARSLARRETVARQAQRVARLGVWQWDAGSDEVTWNPTLYDLFGYEPDEVRPSLDGIRERFHPDDRPRVEAFERAVYAGQPHDPVTFRLTRADGGPPRWVTADFAAGRGPDGRLAWALGTAYDVTDRVVQEEALQFAADEAEKARRAAEHALAASDQAARAKAALLANMSHEIRTPLTGVIGYADLLAEELPPDSVPLVDAIRRGAVRLLQTLSDVLELSRIEGEDYRIRTEPLDVRRPVTEAAEILRQQVESRGLAMTVDVPEAPVVADAEAAVLTRAVFALVSNAAKYTEEGRVAVAVRPGRDGGATVEVRDTGSGIEEAFLPFLFDPFRQESEGDNRRHEGAGLGLALAKRLVEAMGGTIEVASEKGVGSTFTICLQAPADREEERTERGAPRRQRE